MPLMTQIRERMTTFFSVFAGLFVIYIVLDWGMDITGRRQSSRLADAQEIGEINGVSISTREFSDLVRQTSDNQKQQTGTEPDENQLRVIRDQVWNQIVEDRLYSEEIQRLGITVTDNEIRDWVFGDNPPDFLRRQFTDSTGNFDRVRYESTVKDPRNKAIMVKVEDALRKQREREKLQSIVLATVNVSEGDVLQRYSDQNMKYEADYVLLDPNQLVKDDEAKAAEDEVRRYYNEHSDEFKIEASRRLKYIQFSYTPSAKDSDEIRLQVEDIRKRAAAGADFLDLAKTYSETPVAETFYKHGELGQEKETAVFGSKAGDILDPMKEFDGYHLIKVLEFKDGTEEYIRASHILVNIENNDSVAALKKAKELYAAAKRGDDFAELAKKNSKDPGSGARGGDLGWFGKGRMVKPFEEAAFKAKPGQIVGPVRSNFGYHVIKLVGKENREVKIADIHVPIRISTITKNDLDQKAQDFAYLAKEGDFLKEAAQGKYNVVETPAFKRNGAIPGIGMNPTLNRFAFSDKPGTVSEVVTLQNGIGVFMISEAKDAGIKPFEELKTILEGRVIRDKKIEKVKLLANELRQGLSPSDSLQKITSKRPDLTVQRTPEFGMTASLPIIGRDPSFLGGIASLDLHEISKPIAGARGVYLARLTKKTALDTTAYRAQKDNLRTQLMTEKRNRFLTDWSEQLKKSAEIVDNRDLFYH